MFSTIGQEKPLYLCACTMTAAATEVAAAATTLTLHLSVPQARQSQRDLHDTLLHLQSIYDVVQAQVGTVVYLISSLCRQYLAK